jgi:hypothetical protein
MGGAIAGGIDLVVSLFLDYIPVIFNFLGPLASVYILNVTIVLFCSPGFFVAGLLAKRKTGRMSSAMLACTLAVTCFAVIDFCISVIFSFLSPYPAPFNSLFMFGFWFSVFQFWLIDLVSACVVGFSVAALGGAIGGKKA